MSLRVRLLLAVSAVAVVALVVADVATYSALRSFLYGRVDQSLETSHISVERQVDLGQSLGQARLDQLAPGTFVGVRSPAGQLLSYVPAFQRGGHQVTPKLPAHIGGLPAGATFGGTGSSSAPSGRGDGGGPNTGTNTGPSGGPNAGEPHVFFTAHSVESGGPQFRVRVSVLTDGNQLVLATPLDDTMATLHRLLGIELAVTAGALVAAAVLGWWLVAFGLRPLADVERTADAIADGEFGERVPGANPTTEVGRLAVAINTMLGRIEDAFEARDATEAELRRSEERLRRFVADASHELRTPLAAVAAYAELFELGASERPEDLGRVMSGIRSETSRMGRLVNDLLLLARLDEGLPLERKPVELVGLARQAVETALAVGPAWLVELQAADAVEVSGDTNRLRQVIDNLLANVRAHTSPGTRAEVRVQQDGEAAVIQVADHGPGLTDEQAGHVFERFYRADPSRSRQHGGTGLGLGIVAAIVAAHGGQVAVAPTPGGGTTFTVRLPLERDMTASEAQPAIA